MKEGRVTLQKLQDGLESLARPASYYRLHSAIAESLRVSLNGSWRQSIEDAASFSMQSLWNLICTCREFNPGRISLSTELAVIAELLHENEDLHHRFSEDLMNKDRGRRITPAVWSKPFDRSDGKSWYDKDCPEVAVLAYVKAQAFRQRNHFVKLRPTESLDSNEGLEPSVGCITPEDSIVDALLANDMAEKYLCYLISSFVDSTGVREREKAIKMLFYTFKKTHMNESSLKSEELLRLISVFLPCFQFASASSPLQDKEEVFVRGLLTDSWFGGEPDLVADFLQEMKSPAANGILWIASWFLAHYLNTRALPASISYHIHSAKEFAQAHFPEFQDFKPSASQYGEWAGLSGERGRIIAGHWCSVFVVSQSLMDNPDTFKNLEAHATVKIHARMAPLDSQLFTMFLRETGYA